MVSLVEIGRVFKLGSTLVVRIPAAKARDVMLKAGDFVAVRAAGEKLIIERVDTNQLARVKTGELVTPPAGEAE